MTQITWVLSHFTLTSLIDVALVSLLVFAFLRLIEGTRAVQLVRGVVLLFSVATLISILSPFPVLDWIIRTGMPALIVAIPIIFQPELRRGLERLGRAPHVVNPAHTAIPLKLSPALGQVVLACSLLSERHYGGLIVIERTTGLQDLADSGVSIDAVLTADLLLSIFHPGSALHDGAAIVHGDRIRAARCILPLSDSTSMRGSGTRHRAAVSITEQTDAVCFVVSEETAAISIAVGGHLHQHLDQKEIQAVISEIFGANSVLPVRFKRTRRPKVVHETPSA